MSSRLKGTVPGGPATDIAIRPLTSHQDLVACVALQREVWGAAFEDCVPPALLKVTQRVGGLAAGAFDGTDDLLGFVYGITGQVAGSAVHWSHMLAVTPRARGAGIGRRLKEYQRRVVGESGVERIQWSFDPLVARNAHLNLNHLGARVAQYVAAMYPPMSSKLHGALPVDRFVVEWRTDGRPQPRVTPAADGAPVLDWRDGAGVPVGGEGPRFIRLTIPRDFETMIQAAPDEALGARLRTREHFNACQEAGYRVAGFVRTDAEDPYYLLSTD